MKSLLHAEIRKVRYTRSLWLLPLTGAVLAILPAAVLVAAFKPNELATHLSRHGPLRFGATSVGLFVVAFAIRVFGDEVQHHTLAATLIRRPDRRAVYAAKAVVAVGMTLVLTTVIYAFVVPITIVAVQARDLPMIVDGAATAALFGRVCVAMTLSALLGVGLAALVRNRTIALITFLVWITLGEAIVGGLLKIPRFMFGPAVQSLVTPGGPDALPALGAGVLLLAVAVAAVGGGLVALRRDVD